MRLACLLLLASVAGAQEFHTPHITKIVDLTLPFDEHTPYWPSKPRGRFEYSKMFCGDLPNGVYLCMNRFAEPEHGGTHIDASSHFATPNPGVDQIPLDKLMAPAVVIDMVDVAAKNPDAALTRDDILKWERANGPIAAGSIVLIRTRWWKRLQDGGPEKYYGTSNLEDASSVHFPGITVEASGQLVLRHVAAVGIDGPSIDPGLAHDFPAHRNLLGAHIPLLENLGPLHALPVRGAFVIALPMKIARGTGAPTRVVAILP